MKKGIAIVMSILVVLSCFTVVSFANSQTTLDVSYGDIVIGADSVSGYDESGNEVTTVNPNGYVITGTTTEHTVTVEAGNNVNITINNLYIWFDTSKDWGTYAECAFAIKSEKDKPTVVNLTVQGYNTLQSAHGSAGVQNSQYSTLTINGTGILKATGGSGACGIGGGWTNNIYVSDQYYDTIENRSHGGTIIINSGTIISTGTNSGAGIGDGDYGGQSDYTSIATIKIYGGIVKAITNCEGDLVGDIGRGDDHTVYQSNVFYAKNTVIYANRITDTDGKNNSNAIFFNYYGTSGTVIGNPTLSSDLIVPEGATLTIPEGTTLNLADGAKLTVRGSVINNGSIISNGTIIGKENITGSGTLTEDQMIAVSYSVAPTYTVTIPASVELGATAEIKAENVILDNGKMLCIKLTGTSETNNSFKLKTAENAELSYTVNDGTNNISVGDTVLSVNPDDTNTGIVILNFAKQGNEAYAGAYKGTITFTVSVEEVATT
ncbi:MAG: hypothetical protein MR274_07540 [Clostridium sp.]|nr:hypothetical protein [Clostridium sp.]